MFKKLTYHLITTRFFLNTASCVMGFFVWYCISESYTQQQHLKLPLFFYNSVATETINAPESVDVTVAGVRSALRAAHAHGAVHIDAKTLKDGEQLVHVSTENLLLPSGAKMLNYTPIVITHSA